MFPFSFSVAGVCGIPGCCSPPTPLGSTQPSCAEAPTNPSLPSLQDLFSALIKGPTRTPYEDGLYLFDIQLPNIYPAVPPHFCYLSQCSGRLNPNLYDNGKVCVSLLGTWIGKVSTVPTPSRGGRTAGRGQVSGTEVIVLFVCVSGDGEVDEQIQPSPGAHLHPRYGGQGGGRWRGELPEGAVTLAFMSSTSHL